MLLRSGTCQPGKEKRGKKLADLKRFFGGALSLDIAPPEQQLADAMRRAGLEPPPVVTLDGEIHRYKSSAQDKSKSGWYIAHRDDVLCAGAFGDWRTALSETWHESGAEALSAAQLAAMQARVDKMRKDAEEKKETVQEVAAYTVQGIWDRATDADAAHPYLRAKGVEPHGIRVLGDGRLIVPMFDDAGRMMSAQYISPSGAKFYHKGGKVKGASYTIGDALTSTICIVEGFATGASVYDATGFLTVVAFSAHMLPLVLKQVRDKVGLTHDVVIVADNDQNGVGLNYATQAKAQHGARIVCPEPLRDGDTDANDYTQHGGDLKALIAPRDDGWLVPLSSLQGQPSPIKWLVKGWLQDEALMMLHGPSGVGKTFVVLDMCLRIASCVDDWQGRRVRSGPVVYLAGEGLWGLRARANAWLQHHQIGGADMHIGTSPVDLNSADGLSKTIRSIRALSKQPRLIVVDTLHRFFAGDENSAADAKQMIDACDTIRHEFNAAVLMVHHTGISDDAQRRARGSSAWRGALDIEISVSKASGDTLKIEQVKVKDAEQADPVFAELQSVEIDGWIDEDGEQVTSAICIAVDEPEQRSKTTGTTEMHLKRLRSAWERGGHELDSDGNPIIAKSVLRDLLIETGETTPGQVRKWLAPSEGAKMIGYLSKAEIIKTTSTGWALVSPGHVSAWLLQSKN